MTSLGALVLVLSLALAAAVGSQRWSNRLSVPAPALFLAAAAVLSDLVPRIALSTHEIEQLAIVALIPILFDGGMEIGWRRFRSSAAPIVALGTAGTLLTGVLTALAAHLLLGMEPATAALLGAALAPTDPAVLFSVLGDREVGGRSGTILEGESGANDPIGIALMLGVVAYVTADHPSLGTGAATFVLQLGVGALIGFGGGLALRRVIAPASLPSESLYPLRTLAGAGAIFGVATVAHGSGFLAVFIAGILVGDERFPFRSDVVRFHGTVAGVAEIVVFTALGLTIDLSAIGHRGAWLDGAIIAAVLCLAIRPAVVMPLLVRTRLRRGERLFVAWFGLKGAVPILLAAFAVTASAPEADRVYSVVFVVVLASVLVQGSSVSWVAGRLRVPLRPQSLAPWRLSLPLAAEPGNVRRCVVDPGSRAVGVPIRDVPLGANTWIGLIIRGGTVVQPRGSTTIEAGDEILLIGDDDRTAALRRLFGAPA